MRNAAPWVRGRPGNTGDRAVFSFGLHLCGASPAASELRMSRTAARVTDSPPQKPMFLVQQSPCADEAESELPYSGTQRKCPPARRKTLAPAPPAMPSRAMLMLFMETAISRGQAEATWLHSEGRGDAAGCRGQQETWATSLSGVFRASLTFLALVQTRRGCRPTLRRGRLRSGGCPR